MLVLCMLVMAVMEMRSGRRSERVVYGAVAAVMLVEGIARLWR